MNSGKTREIKESFKEKYQVGIGFMSFFTKAVCAALQEYPIMNARVEEENIIYQHFCDIGIAVSSPKGLVVPVVKNAHTLSFRDIEASILGYALKAREGKLTPDD